MKPRTAIYAKPIWATRITRLYMPVLRCPNQTYLTYKTELDNLGNRPIGETLLYSNPTTTRSDFEIKRITQDDELLFDELVHTNFYRAVIERNARVPELWARRSVFTLQGHPLLITEVFLSDIPDYID